jgi:hypothetical protein
MEKENLKQLFAVIKSKHIDIGEALLVVYRTFEKTYNLTKASFICSLNESPVTVWELLPDSALESLKEWWINNWYRVYSILAPKRHNQIMQMTSPEAREYQEWFNSQGEKGHKMMKDFKAEPWYITQEA